MKLKIQQLKYKKKELEKKKALAKKHKKEILTRVQKTIHKYQNKEITKSQYHQTIKNKLGNKSAEQWAKYYNSYTNNCNYQISKCDKEIKFNIFKSLAFKSVYLILILILITATIQLMFFFSEKQILLAPAGPGEIIDLRAQTCLASDTQGTPDSYTSSCQGVYPASCPSDLLSCPDTSQETLNVKKNTYSGNLIETFNSAIIDCDSINSVLLCYQWSIDSPSTYSDCLIAVDTDNGASYSTVITACPTTTPSLTCVDVTSLESWTCSNFFGSSGTRASAKTQISRTGGGRPNILSTDALYFSIDYNQADIIQPIISINSIGSDAIPPYSTSDNAPIAILTTDENADCRASLLDESYDDMSDDIDCLGDGTTSHSCQFNSIPDSLSQEIYFACQDLYGNKNTIDNNLDSTTEIDTLTPIQSNHNPPISSTLTTTNPTITFNTDENADCRASLLDESYDDMSDDFDCTGDGTTTQTCSLSGLSNGPVTIYTACQDDTDVSPNKDTSLTNTPLDYIITIIDPPPIISINSIGSDAIPPYSTSDNAPIAILTTDENADCRASLLDESYDDMSDDIDCLGDGTTSHSCQFNSIPDSLSQEIYFACQDLYGNKNTIDNNLDSTTEIDTLTPIQSNHNPPISSTLTTTNPTITFNTDENADCRASLLDESYDDMSDDFDCTGDGTTTQTCSLSGLSNGPVTIYTACQDDTDVSPNKDTSLTNTPLDYTISIINYPPSTPSSILCDTTLNCDITIDSKVKLNADDSVDPESDPITYFFEALLLDTATSQNLAPSEIQIIASNPDTEATKPWQTHNNIFSSNIDEITTLNIIISLSEYDNSGSLNNLNNLPDIEVELFNGISFVNIGTFSINQNKEYSISITNPSILNAWRDYENTDLRIRGINFDYSDSNNYDIISYNDLHVIANTKTWTEIGSLSSGPFIWWDVSTITDQSCINLRTRAIDQTGSNTFSDYYTKDSCFNIEHPNQAPSILDLSNISPQTITESGTTSVTFYIDISDDNSFNDLDSSTVNAAFSRTDETTRTDQLCDHLYNINPTTSRYECLIDIQYWDGAGTWDVTANAQDLSAQSTSYQETFLILETTCISIPASESPLWNTLIPGTTNQISLNNPLTIWNTCNHEGQIQVKSYNLIGQTNPAYIIPAFNFKIHYTGVDQCISGTQMSDSISTTLINTFLPRGDNSLDQGKEELYFCMAQVPDPLPAQDYSATNFWEITILSALFIRKKKKEEAIKAIKKLLRKNNINVNELIETKTYKSKQIKIPLEIFKQDISPSESLIKYMKENLNLRYNEIALQLNRDQRTIWITYRNASKKKKEPFTIKKNKNLISLSLFNNRKLSILESLIRYMKEKGLRNIEIAKTLNKDPRNIYTLYTRAIKKLENE